MKKAVIIILIVAVVGGGYYFLTRPKSPEIFAEITRRTENIDESKFLTNEFYRLRIQQDLEDLYIKLVDAYVDEKEYGLAMSILQNNLDSNKGRKTQLRYAQEALWYIRQARIYDLMGNASAAETARKKSDAASKKAKTAPVRLE